MEQNVIVDCETQQRPTVLVVEDHPTTRKLMSAWLETSGYPVLEAEDGNAAWKSAQFECPPIVVTDWNMPEMTGVELCRYIRENHGTDEVYVLIATSRERDVDLSEAMDAGANDFLSKPIREDEFLARIRSAENQLKRIQAQTELAESDGLTGLLNRRSFFQRGQKRVDEAREAAEPLSCILLDIDLFKQFNDELGHAVGDKVLVTVGSVLAEECRDYDLVARVGGDEFCMLLTRASEQQAVEIAERIRSSIAARTIETDELAVRIRTTLGVAPLSPEIESVHELVETADRILLAAKNEGRDRTMSLRDLCRRHRDVGNQHQGTKKNLLQTTLARDIMNDSPLLLAEHQTMRNARSILLDADVDCVCVVDPESQLLGMVTERDLLNALAAGDDPNATLQSVMSSNVARFREDTPVIQIWECLQRTPMLRNIIVDDQGVPIGLVRRRSLLRLLHSLEELESAMA